MDERGDAEIIATSLERPVEFAAIFDRHYESVRRYAARRIGPELADDLAAAAFEAALRSRSRFDLRESSARPWLLGIATNLIRHHLRSEQRRLHAFDRMEKPGSVADHAERADRRMDAERMAPILRAALAAMPRAERDALLLLAWADLSYQEIATALAIPIGTVRSRISRARARLRERIHASGQYLAEKPKHVELVNADG